MKTKREVVLLNLSYLKQIVEEFKVIQLQEKIKELLQQKTCDIPSDKNKERLQNQFDNAKNIIIRIEILSNKYQSDRDFNVLKDFFEKKYAFETISVEVLDEMINIINLMINKENGLMNNKSVNAIYSELAIKDVGAILSEKECKKLSELNEFLFLIKRIEENDEAGKIIEATGPSKNYFDNWKSYCECKISEILNLNTSK